MTIQQIEDSLDKSFKGTFRDAMKNGYTLDKHYVIIDWKFYHELLKEEQLKTDAKEVSGGENDNQG